MLDTSVIIDGRIADICETGFIDGTLVVPQFVLKELQMVADSSDSMKRNRGRRGLDILQKIQKMAGVDVIISDMDFPDVREVDLKLIELARALQGKIVTNDFNLNKVAQLRGVEVLNINELANSLKPVVLPGEVMKVFILKEGKEYNQGVAYLDDGTMVVVDNARKMIGKTIDIVVTSVLQTTAGKMIFGRFIDAGGGHAGALPAARPQMPSGPPQCRGGNSRADARQADGSAFESALTLRDSSLPLVADRLLSHPGHRPVHDRSRHAVHGFQPFRRARLLRALVRAYLGATDPADDRRIGSCRGPRAGRAGGSTCSCRIIRATTTRRCSLPRCRTSYGSSPRTRSGSFPFLGWHLRRTGHILVDRKRPDRTAIFGWADRLPTRACRSSSIPKAPEVPTAGFTVSSPVVSRLRCRLACRLCRCHSSARGG